MSDPEVSAKGTRNTPSHRRRDVQELRDVLEN
jgi:hypothetical protein